MEQFTKLCECGCGEFTPIARSTRRDHDQFRGQPHKFIPGHGKRSLRMIGPADYTVEDRGFSTECWIWAKRGFSTLGYAKITYHSERTWAHIASWEQTHHQRVPEGLELDHLCRVPSCIRPDHLEPVTHRENLRRGKGTRVTPEVFSEIKRLRSTGLTHREIAQELGIGKSTVGYNLNGEHLP